MILGILLLLGIVLLLVILHRKPKQALPSMFNNTSSDSVTLGGLLVSLVSLNDAKNMLKKGRVEYIDFAQCASIHRKTCAPWSYLRRDIWGAGFITPGMGTRIGFIVDPKIIWSLLTTMAVIDADTNIRSVCSNEQGSNLYVKSPCTTTDGAYISQAYEGQMPTECDEADVKCQIINSGGSINIRDYMDNWNSCSSCIRQHGNEVSLNGCSICQKPYLCVAKTPPQGSINPIEEEKQVSAYVGPNSEQWSSLFLQLPPNIGDVTTRQCKFSKNNWAEWVKALHIFYKYLLDTQDLETYSKYPSLRLDPNSSIPYLENEINSYIYPNQASPLYQAQNKIFLKSLRAVFYIDSTCEEQLALLKTFSNIKTTCDLFYNPSGSSKPISGEKRLALEIEERTQSLTYATQLGKLLNLPVYKARLDSNTFPNYATLRQALAGTLTFEQYFQCI